MDFDYLFASDTTIVSENTILGMTGGDIIGVYLEEEAGIYPPQKDIASLIRDLRGTTIIPKWRIYLLYADDTIRRRFPEEDILLGGSYSETYQTGQRRSLSFSLDNTSGQYSPNVNAIWLNARLRLDMGITLESGATLWFVKGIYVVTNIAESINAGQRLVSVTAADKWALFASSTGTLEDTYEIEPGSDIYSIICSILQTNDGAGNPLDSKPPIYHHSFMGKKTQATITENAGASYASLLLDLATQLSAEMFYNALGELVVMPLDETINDSMKMVLYDLTEEDGDFDRLDFSFNASDIKNRVIVIGSTNKGNYSRAVASNDNADSPTSTKRIGIRTAPIINDSNILSDYLAEERAAYELRKVLLAKTVTSITIALNPLLSVNNLITITSSSARLSKQRFLLQSISCSLDYSGTMSISFSNVENLPFLMRATQYQDISTEVSQ